MSDLADSFRNLVRPAIKAIRVVLRPLTRALEKRQIRRKLLSDLNASGCEYEFSELDINLHVAERVISLPRHVSEDSDDPDLVKITVCGTTIFWPALLPGSDLSWLYHEVFDDFDSNPSSYNHPGLDYQNRSWVIDAGAAEGYFSVFAFKKSPHARVICIEPLSLMRNALSRTLSLYDHDNKSSIVSAALADQSGWAELQLDYEHISDSKIGVSTCWPDSGESIPVTEKVEIITLDQLAVEHSLEYGGLVKMDIEGFEMAALSGATDLLKKFKPALAIAVYHELDNAHKCADIIRGANPEYDISFRGCYGFYHPPRPYILFAV